MKTRAGSTRLTLAGPFDALALAVPLALVLGVGPSLVACGGESANAAPPATASDPSTSASAATLPPAPTDTPPPATGASKRPLDLKSACATPTTIYLGDDPARTETTETSGKRNVDANGSLPLSRRADGSQTVWLLDEKGAPLVKVNITRGMNTVEIGKSCRTIDSFMRR